jgi:hypothetical protein
MGVASGRGIVALWVTPSFAILAVLAATACGTDAVGVDACQEVESARCRAAPGCGVSIEPPFSTSGSNVDACIRYYDIACLHGLASGNEPAPAAVSACVAAIAAHPCDAHAANLVETPESDPACAWLIPPSPAPTVDASPEADGDADAPGS